MKFYINKLVLWFNNGKKRELEFKPNKVNIITGESGTGKSEIMSIIDYCFFSSKANITERIINENIHWYGIQFDVNDKTYTIARGKISENHPSLQYFFSSDGEIPSIPEVNIDEKSIKLIIDKEFSITERTVFPYGGNKITLGSKISPRYFFMFNTQSGDVISHSEVFFDKQNNDKYREALERIFDLAVGIETEENLRVKEKINSLQKEIVSLQRKIGAVQKEKDLFKKNILVLSRKAKEHNLIDYNETDFDTIFMRLKEIVHDYKEETIDFNLNKVNKLKSQKNALIRKVRSLRNFQKEFDDYKKVETANLDSLMPIKAIKEAHFNLFDSPDLKLLLNILEDEFNTIKKNIAGKPPFEFDVNKKISEYEKDIQKISEEIISIPLGEKKTKNEIDKLIFIGELKAKLSFYEKEGDELDELNELLREMKSKEELKTELEKGVVDVADRKESTLRLLDENVQSYFDMSKDAIIDYANYKTTYNYKEKKLQLRREKSNLIEKVGSSSNHMFLHLCLILGIQELVIRQQSPYVPYWLILDQPSRPYFSDESEPAKKIHWKDVIKSDRSRITIAMKLLNDFITYVKEELNTDYQIILLEHIPKSIWDEAKLDNFHLVEKEFTQGNALIRFDDGGEPY